MGHSSWYEGSEQKNSETMNYEPSTMNY